MSFFGNVFDFEKSNFGTMWDQIKEDPERLFLGAADPIGGKLWGGILGKDYEPIVNEWGGASDYSYEQAEKQGIDTKSGKKMHDVAEVIASIYAGGEGMDALGGAFGGGAGGSSSSTVGPSTRGFASGSGAGQAAGSGGAGAGATDWGGLLQQFGSMPGGGGGQQPQQAQQPVQYAPQGGIQFKPVKPQYFGYFNPQQSTGLLG